MESNTSKPPISEYGFGERLLGGAGGGFDDQLLASSCNSMDGIELNESYDFGTNYMTGQLPHSPTAFADSTFTSLEWMPRIQGHFKLPNSLRGPNYSGPTTNDTESCVAHLGFCDCNCCLSDEFLSQDNGQHPDQLEILRQPETRTKKVKKTYEGLVIVEGNCIPLDPRQEALVGEAESGTQPKMSSKQWKLQPKPAFPHGVNHEVIYTGLGQHGSFSQNIGQYQRHNVLADMKTNLHMENSALDESHQEEASSASSLTSSNSTASTHSSPGLSPSGSSSHLFVDSSADMLVHRPSLETGTKHSSGRGNISTKAQHQPKTQYQFVNKSPSGPYKYSPKVSNASALRWSSPATSLSDGVRRLEVNREMLPYPTEIQKKALAIVTGLSYNLVMDFYEDKHSNPSDSAYCSNSSRKDSTGGLHEHVQDTSSSEEQPKLSPKDQKKALQKNAVSETFLAETSKRFQCTWHWKGCSKSFDKKGDWIRHEETVHCLQEFWTCHLPGRSGIMECGRVYKVDYKCREHLRKDHKYDERSAIQMAEGFRQAVSPPRPFRDECGFCGGRFTDWKERMVHIAEHAEKGKRMSEWQDPFPRGKGAGPNGPDDDNNDGGNDGSGSGHGNSSNGKSNHSGNGGHWIQPKPRRDGDSDQRGNKRRYNGDDWNQRSHKSSLIEPILESGRRLIDFFRTYCPRIWVVQEINLQESYHSTKDTKRRCISDSLDKPAHEEEQGWKRSRLPTVFLNSSKVVTKPPPQLEQLGYISVFCVIINKMIGTGIFDAPFKILHDTKSVGFSLIFWLLSAIATMASVLIFIEHGLTIPHRVLNGTRIYSLRSGGEQNYLSYLIKHPKLFTSCVFGIAFILTGNAAANASSFAVHIVRAAGYADFYADSPSWNISSYVSVIVVGTMMVICLMHGIWRRAGIAVNNVFAIFMILILLIMNMILGFMSVGDKVSNTPPPNSKNLDQSLTFKKAQNEPYGYALAYLGVVFAFGGFCEGDYVLGEIREAKKVFRSPTLFAVGTACMSYILVNIAYMIVIPEDQQVNGNVAEIFIKLTLGRVSKYGNIYASEILNAFLAVSALGNVIVSTYIAARVKQEIAKEGVLPLFPSSRNYDAVCTAFIAVATGVLSGAELVVMYVSSMTCFDSTTLLSRIIRNHRQGGAAERDLQAEDGNWGGSSGEQMRYARGGVKSGEPNPPTTEPH